MILALRGAKDRMEGEFRNHMRSAWLIGILSQCDPKNYPELESLTGDKSPTQVETDPKEASHNARLWGVWLKQENQQKNGVSDAR